MIFNFFLFIIFGALMLIVGVPLLLLGLMRRRYRNPADPSAQTGRPFSGFRTRRNSREGEVTVSGQDATSGEKIVGDHVGEYVDYEEVEEKK